MILVSERSFLMLCTGRAMNHGEEVERVFCNVFMGYAKFKDISMRAIFFANQRDIINSYIASGFPFVKSFVCCF